MTIETRLAAAASRVEAALLLDACLIERLVPSETYNVVTLTADAATATTIYTGSCLFNSPSMKLDGSLASVGIQLTTSTMRIVLPISATGIEAGDQLTVTAASLFPELVGLVGPVVIGARASLSTIREVYADLETRIR